MKTEINPKDVKFETICRDCVFCEYEGETPTQVGCKFHNRLFNFENNNGATLVGQDDGLRRYFKFDRACTACHNTASLQQIPRRKWKTYVEDRIALRIDYIIQVNEGDEIADVIRTTLDVKDQDPAPFSIIINFSPDFVGSNEYIAELIDLFNKELKLKVKWQIEKLPLEKVLKLCKGIHYAYFQAGQTLPTNYARVINKALNYDMKPIVALTPSKVCPGLFVQRKGSYGLTEILKKEEKGEHVKCWEDLLDE